MHSLISWKAWVKIWEKFEKILKLIDYGGDLDSGLNVE